MIYNFVPSLKIYGIPPALFITSSVATCASYSVYIYSLDVVVVLSLNIEQSEYYCVLELCAMILFMIAT